MYKYSSIASSYSRNWHSQVALVVKNLLADARDIRDVVSINNLRYTDDTTLMIESEEQLTRFLMTVKEESEKILKLNIQKTKIMASSPITSWKIDGETVETVADFTLSGFRITADGDCSHEIKRRLLLGRKILTNLDSILKSRDITLSTRSV